VHVLGRAWRNIVLALALATFALPLATAVPGATPASAQTNPQAVAPSSIAIGGGPCVAFTSASCYVTANPGLAFNIVGTTHTVRFTCGSAVGPAPAGAPINTGAPASTDLSGGRANAAAPPAGPGLVPGCYNVSASVTDETTGTASTFTYARCGNNATTLTGSTINCAQYESPVCPLGGMTTPGFPYCSTPDANALSLNSSAAQVAVSINPGAPHSYLITFTGYTPLLATCATVIATGGRGTCTPVAGSTVTAACPVGFTYVPGPFNLSESIFTPPFEATATAPDGVCRFQVAAEKKYVEITNLTLTGTGPCAAGASASTLVFAEGLKTFFGAPCLVTATAVGIVILKSGVDCAAEPPANGTPASAASAAGFPPGSTYQCVGGTLSVRIPNIGANTLNSGPVPIVVTVNNGGPTPGSTLPTPSLGGLCTGIPGTSLATFTGSTFTICPVAAGTGSVKACTAGAAIDTQPIVCSNTLTFTFLLPSAKRVVPYVRWAGEKQVLTKCFGGAGLFGGSLVEFTLEGGGAQAQAALIPASLNGQPGSFGGSEPVAVPSQNTVITVTDVDGCASVIVYAASEGVVNVDAAIFSTAPTVFGTSPLINEHAFEIFYLKFDHVDLENISFTHYTANPLAQIGLTANNPPGVLALPGPTCPTANPYLVVSGVCLPFISLDTPAGGYDLPNPPGTNPPGPNGYSVPLCQFDLVRAMVHGYFEYPGDPSGRPATTVGITGAPSNAAGSYTLPAGRWVLPEDWPVLATFAGFNSAGNPNNTVASSVYAWDLNTGWAFNPTGELPVVCAGPQPYNQFLGYGPITDLTAFTQTNVSEGPCYGLDVNQKSAFNGTFNGYSTAPDPNNCDGLFPGLTVGIGPFDPTQACTNPFPLAYSPSGSSVLVGGPNFGVAPLSTNSTYLPNGTLNEWDAPMPPAQVQFSINSGPGFLTEVNKTGLYQVPLVATGLTPAQCAAANPAFINFSQTGTTGSPLYGNPGNSAFLPGNTTNPIGGSTSTAVGTCQISSAYPDPFYAEAIPASPLIPPITNNGGYLWDTFGFRGGLTLGPTTSPAFVPGLAPTTNIPGAPCGETLATPSGFTFVGGAAQNSVGSCFVGSGGTPEQQVTLAECNALGGTWTQVFPQGSFGPGSAATGTCEIPVAPASAPSGINVTNFGPGCPAFAGLQPIPQAPFPPGAYSGKVQVADATGFVPGLTVTVVDLHTGKVIASGLKVTDVTGNVITFDLSTVPAGLCVSVYGAAFISEQIAVTVPGSNSALAAIGAGTGVSVTTPFTGGFLSTPSATSSIFMVNGNTLFLSGAAALANALGNCSLITMTAGQLTTCLASVFLPAGAIIVANPSVGVAPILDGLELFGGQGPYPFWQWVPNPSVNSTTQRIATMYSDNHGESVVALQTGVTTQLAPVGGACPSGYVLTANGTNCLLNLAKLSTTSSATNFQNVAAALGLKTAGCITTTPAGGVAPAPTAAAATTATAAATSVVGGTGPTDGQICINNLGGIEFGPSATLGLTTISAIADYPYNRGLHPAVSSGNINKIFTSAFNKSVTVSPALGGPAGTTSYTVTVTGTDICGNPIVGEQVNVFALSSVAGAVILAPLGQGTANGTSSATVALNGNGQAQLSLEVLNQSLGNSGLVIKAVFPLEAIERFVTVIAGNAGTGLTQQIYPPGYNMVGGPPGSNFGQAEALFTYDPATGTYGAAGSTNISSAAPTCVGYWAYFASATTVSLPVTSKAGDTATCSLQEGWNLVGNPFGSAANLPAGVTAYHYNPASQAYDLVTQIPLGGSVFIFEAGPNTVMLTAT
jgi:hypothetical protein